MGDCGKSVPVSGHVPTTTLPEPITSMIVSPDGGVTSGFHSNGFTRLLGIKWTGSSS